MGNGTTDQREFTQTELAYFAYVDSKGKLSGAAANVVDLKEQRKRIETEIDSAKIKEAEADDTFRESLEKVIEAIDADELMDPLKKYIWKSSFAWAIREKSVTADTDVVAFATGFQERVETIQARMFEGAPLIAVDWHADNTVYGGVLQGSKFVVSDDGVKTPTINAVKAWAGYGHKEEWHRFRPATEEDLRLFKDTMLKDESPLDDKGHGLDIIGGWDEQPGLAREQKIFIGIEEIRNFLRDETRKVNQRFHGLLAAGFAGVDIASIETELPEDLRNQRNTVAAEIANDIAKKILSDAVNESSDKSLSASATKYLDTVELPTPEDVSLYLKGLGISKEKLVELVNDQLEKMGNRDFIIKSVTAQALSDDQVATRVAGLLESKPLALAR